MIRHRLILVALCLTPVGCRTESRDAAEAAKMAYRATVASQAARFGPKVMTLVAALQKASTVEDIIGPAKEAEAEAAAFIRVLDGVRVPSAYEAGHAKMKGGLARFASALPMFIHARQVSDKVEEADATRLFAEANVDIVDAKGMIFEGEDERAQDKASSTPTPPAMQAALRDSSPAGIVGQWRGSDCYAGESYEFRRDGTYAYIQRTSIDGRYYLVGDQLDLHNDVLDPQGNNHHLSSSYQVIVDGHGLKMKLMSMTTDGTKDKKWWVDRWCSYTKL